MNKIMNPKRFSFLLGQRILARDIESGPVETLGGEIVNLFKTQRGGVSIIYDGNASKVVKADVRASNGIIHIIDNVIVSL